jgi:sugar lactone lactonase YvrE
MARIGLCVGVLLLSVVPAVAQDMPLSQILIDGQGWRSEDGGFALAVDSQGTMYHTDPKSKGITGVRPDGIFLQYPVDDTLGIWSIAFGPDGRLYASQRERNRIVRWDRKEGRKPQVLTEGIAAFGFVVSRAGAIYCTVPAEKAVYLITPDGKKRIVDKGIASPTGLVLTPDEGTLVVGDYEGKHLYAFRVEKDGSLSAKEPYYTLRLLTGQTAGGARGMTVDTDGRVYVSTLAGVQVFDPTGRLSGVLSKPAVIAPVALRNAEPNPLLFGGANRDVLYMVCDHKVFSRKLKSKGLPLPAEPEK